MMERDQNFEDPHLTTLEGGEPHFNDERTMQTARRVVPLNVFSRILTRRRLALSLAFVLAAVLGAGTALAIIQLRQPATTTLAEGSTREDNDEQPVAELPPSEDQSQPAEESPAISNSETDTITTRRPTRAPRQAGIPQTSPSTPKVTLSIKTIESEPQAQLVDEWQERRQRRAVRPERPNNHHKRDLFRIREIFEGPRPE